MSQELNLDELGYGSLDPGWTVEIYRWTTSEQSYSEHRRRARFFTAIPDSVIPLGDFGTIEFFPNVVQVEITRQWNMVRVDENEAKADYTELKNGEWLSTAGSGYRWKSSSRDAYDTAVPWIHAGACSFSHTAPR